MKKIIKKHISPHPQGTKVFMLDTTLHCYAVGFLTLRAS